jgi:hypothetical protein
MKDLLLQIIEHYESESYHLSGFIQRYKDLSLETLEEIILDFQGLYQFGDSDQETSAFIHSDDWFVFRHWEPCYQADFLAYLAIKIAYGRAAKG